MKIRHLPLKINLGTAIALLPTALISCNSTSTNEDNICSWTKGTEYVPMDPKEFDTPFASENDIMTSYQKDISDNKLIFSDDKVYYFCKMDGVLADINKVSCNTLSVGDMEHIVTNVERDIFRINMEIDIDATVKIKDNSLVFKNKKLKFTNIPMHVIYNKITQVKVDVIVVSYDKLWSINFPELKKDDQGNLIVGNDNVEYNYTNLPVDPDIKNTLIGLMQATIDFDTNYYSKGVVGQ